MNEEMKRLIEVLNNAGYEVMEIADPEYSDEYGLSGVFNLKVYNTAKKGAKSHSGANFA